MAKNINNNYGIGTAISSELQLPIVAKRAPTGSDKNYALGTVWINQPASSIYILASVINNSANWTPQSAGSIVNANPVNINVNAGVNVTNINTGTTTGNVNIGSQNVVQTNILAGTLNLNNNAGADVTNIGSGTTTGAITIGSANTGTVAIASGAALTEDAVGAVSINSSGAAINIGNNANAFAINIGTAGARANITLGNTTALTGVRVSYGTGNLVVAGSATSTATYGAATDTGTLTIAPSTAAGGQTINFATGGTGVKTIHFGDGAIGNIITIGSTSAAASTTIQAGTGGIALSAAGIVTVAAATDSHASPTATATVNANVGKATFTGFTTASAATQAFVVNCSKVVTGSEAILVTVTNKKNVNDAQMSLVACVTEAGKFTVDTKNNGTQALDGDVVISFWVMG